ncbi:MAG: AprI/Inh family metalloprotease inhibitor [Rhizomicrobium sp.]
MNKLSSLALGAALAFTTIGMAHAADSAAGTWKLATGVADAPCMITLTADASVADAGTVTSTGDCNGTTVGRWHDQPNGLQLLSSNGTLVAWLKPKGDVYEGTRLSDGRKVALSH